MSTYDFSTLNDKDFEEIVCDLLSAEMNLRFQSFKSGRDNGIDLRYSTEEDENEIVVQVKHYLKTGKTGLFSALKTKELDNIKSLNVKRYMVVTSIALNPDDKKKIKDNLKPFVHSTQDVIGKDDMNRLLTKHGSIEEKHFKLWFNNTKVLNKIINNGIKGRSEFVEFKIKKNIGLFVKTESFDSAQKILNTERVLLITGIPGIGKTTLSYLLSYYFLAKGFELVFCENGFTEAESVFGDLKKKQIFLFDDFLGDSYLEIQSGRNKTINSFIERVRASKNKFIILTTRTSILSQAKNLHEKLDRINFNSTNFELKISDYNDLDKAQILYNHLYFYKINKKYIGELIEDKNYLKIIHHSSYNPRLLEFITNTDHFIAEKFDNSYLKFCLFNLNYPNQIWEKPFWNQLDEYERDMLFCLLSLGRSVELESLESVFNDKVSHDISKNLKTFKPNAFKTTFKVLLNGYIKSTVDRNSKTTIDFINPSLKDFIIKYFNDNKNERSQFVRSFSFIEQFYTFFNNRNLSGGNNIYFDTLDVMLSFAQLRLGEIKSVKSADTSDVNLLIATFLDQHYSIFYKSGELPKIEEYQMSILKVVDWDNVEMKFLKGIFKILESVDVKSELGGYLINIFKSRLDIFLDRIDSEYDLITLKGVEEKFELDIVTLLTNYSKLDSLKKCIERIYEGLADDYFDVYSIEINEESDFNREVTKIWDIQHELSSKYFNNMDLEFNYNPIEERGFVKIVDENLESKYDTSNDWSNYNKLIDRDSFEADIDVLFSRFNRN